MAILATEILIKTAIEAGIEDLKRNPWMIDDIFNGLVGDPLSSLEYGAKEVQDAREWFLNNKINVYLGFRVDLPTMPAVSIVRQSVTEALDRTSLADEGLLEEIDHRQADRVPDQVLTKFTPQAYDREQGLILLPEPLTTAQVAKGMFVVNSDGKAYQIIATPSIRAIQIQPNTKVNLTNAVITPATKLWNLHRELTYFHESFQIGVHSTSEPVVNLWFTQIMTYILLRYKEAYIENRGFELSTFSITGTQLNDNFTMERVFSSFFNFTGTVQADWIKFIAPKLANTSANFDIAKVVTGEKQPPLSITPEQYRNQVRSQTWAMKGDEIWM
jgi:hypothetical protein